jgi:RNA polymerase sigma-70 factor (ECF subfamily)
MHVTTQGALRMLTTARDGGGTAARSRTAGNDGAPDREAGLVERARRDREAFAELYRAHYAAIGAYLFRRCGDAHATEDLLNEVFLSAFRALPRFVLREVPFRAWLYRIATRAANRHLRREARRPEPIDEPGALVDAESERRGAHDAADECAWVQRCLRRLAPNHQAVLVLHYVEGMGVEEVAGVLRCRPGTVKSRLARGRAALERVMGGAS